MKKPESVDEYLSDFPEATRLILEKIRAVIKAVAPEAEESFSYGMPAYKLNGRPLVYFAGYEKHIGFYATPTGHAAFSEELSKYKQGKGSVQFPVNEPMPLDLISRIVKFRAEENLGSTKNKKSPDC